MQNGGAPLQGSDQHLLRVPVVALIVPGPCRFFGLFGRGEEFYIPWECIKQIGDDIILIDKPAERRPPYQDKRRRRKPFF